MTRFFGVFFLNDNQMYGLNRRLGQMTSFFINRKEQIPFSVAKVQPFISKWERRQQFIYANAIAH